MSKEQRVFKVDVKGEEKSRLIRAKGPATARDKVAAEVIAVKEATPEELVEMGALGVVIEPGL